MDEVEIVDYDPRWPLLFEREAALLRSALPHDMVLGVEHIGSTAVPGLAAKPVIDTLVLVRALSEARRLAIAPLEALGYAFWADNPKQDRLFFVKGLPPTARRRTHHAHFLEPGREAEDRLLFRDYLRAHSKEARKYERLKRELAAAHRHDREAYTEAKTAFVSEALKAARAPRGFLLDQEGAPRNLERDEQRGHRGEDHD